MKGSVGSTFSQLQETKVEQFKKISYRNLPSEPKNKEGCKEASC